MIRDKLMLLKLFPTISRTFAFTIPKLPKETANDLMVCYSVCRVIDTIEDSSLENSRKSEYMNCFLVLLKKESYGEIDKNEIEHCRTLLLKVPTTEDYRGLLKNIDGLIRSVISLPEEIRDVVIDTGVDMANGFLDKSVQNIETIEDQNLYCHYAAGIVGHAITKIFFKRGYIDKYRYDELLPLSHDFGLALQKVNIIKDLIEDLKDERYYWPKSLLDKNGLSYELISELSKVSLNATVSESHARNMKKAMGLLHEMIEDAGPYIQKGMLYIEKLPYEPPGIKIFCAENLMMAIATLREIKNAKVFFSDKDVKISREEVLSIDFKVRESVDKRIGLDRLAEQITGGVCQN